MLHTKNISHISYTYGSKLVKLFMSYSNLVCKIIQNDTYQE